MLAEFVYCYMLRPWPLRQLTNWTIRQLLPKQVEILYKQMVHLCYYLLRKYQILSSLLLMQTHKPHDPLH